MTLIDDDCDYPRWYHPATADAARQVTDYRGRQGIAAALLYVVPGFNQWPQVGESYLHGRQHLSEIFDSEEHLISQGYQRCGDPNP